MVLSPTWFHVALIQEKAVKVKEHVAAHECHIRRQSLVCRGQFSYQLIPICSLNFQISQSRLKVYIFMFNCTEK